MNRRSFRMPGDAERGRQIIFESNLRIDEAGETPIDLR